MYGFIHAFDNFLGSSFLQTENYGASLLSIKWVSHITGNAESAFFKPLIHLASVDCRHVGQVSATNPRKFSICLVKLPAQRE